MRSRLSIRGIATTNYLELVLCSEISSSSALAETRGETLPFIPSFVSVTQTRRAMRYLTMRKRIMAATKMPMM